MGSREVDTRSPAVALDLIKEGPVELRHMVYEAHRKRWDIWRDIKLCVEYFHQPVEGCLTVNLGSNTCANATVFNKHGQVCMQPAKLDDLRYTRSMYFVLDATKYMAPPNQACVTSVAHLMSSFVNLQAVSARVYGYGWDEAMRAKVVLLEAFIGDIIHLPRLRTLRIENDPQWYGQWQLNTVFAAAQQAFDASAVMRRRFRFTNAWVVLNSKALEPVLHWAPEIGVVGGLFDDPASASNEILMFATSIAFVSLSSQHSPLTHDTSNEYEDRLGS